MGRHGAALRHQPDAGIALGRVAAIAIGTTAVASEFWGGALGLTPAAVPDRRRCLAAKAAAIALPVPAVGPLTGLVTLLVGRTVLADSGPAWAEGPRGAVGCGLCLTPTALFAAGIAAVPCSGVATLSLLIPFLLIVSFVVGDLPGQVALHRPREGSLGPWSGLAVTALWTAAALLAGARALVGRDA
ncbi:ABC transporter permease [Streptomyces sp. NPDC006314]|uniref:ABC transporter permease n=1 Tax=Streptomyces sp. NPDC006314 TaxID=3154475 RepID=UPI0033B1895E